MQKVSSLTGRQCVCLSAGLSALAVLAYAPVLTLPLISDDFGVIETARKYGWVDGWAALLRDPLYRCRALSNVIGYWLYEWAGLQPVAYNVASLLLHILNTFLVAALGMWNPIGYRVSLPAAAFFAVAEGHQEAVIWFSALPDLNAFTFTVAAFLAFALWLQNERRSAGLYVSALGLFIVALLSKESAVALVGLQVLAVVVSRTRLRTAVWAIAPFALFSAAYFALAWIARGSHQHFGDGTFSLSAPFLWVVINSTGRMLWIWGVIAIGVLVALRQRSAIPVVAIALVWAAITVVPYSFLTYMPRVPSRHTYIPSVGLALIVGAGFAALQARFWESRRRIVALAAMLVVLHNVGYLWTRKYRQFVERARPTEELIRLARTTTGPIVVECFPFPKPVAQSAIRVGAGSDPARLKFVDPPACREWRYSVEDESLADARSGETALAP